MLLLQCNTEWSDSLFPTQILTLNLCLLSWLICGLFDFKGFQFHVILFGLVVVKETANATENRICQFPVCEAVGMGPQPGPRHSHINGSGTLTRLNNFISLFSNIFDSLQKPTLHLMMRSQSLCLFNMSAVMSGSRSSKSPKNTVFSATLEKAKTLDIR